MQATIRPVGQFCWINMLTPDPAAAREFFATLLGWTYAEMPGVGHRMQVQGRDIGGMFDLNGPNTPPGTPPCIGVMVKVESADATARRVVELGGKALPPMDVFDAGRMAVCFDPAGANFDVWEPRSQQGTDADPSAVGAPSWHEVLSSDGARAAKFYTGLFGWTAQAVPMSTFSYTTFHQGTELVGGMMPILREMGNVVPCWSVYFNVADVDAACATAKAAGGSVYIEPHDIPNVGRFAGIVSPQGVMFYVIRYA